MASPNNTSPLSTCEALPATIDTQPVDHSVQNELWQHKTTDFRCTKRGRVSDGVMAGISLTFPGSGSADNVTQATYEATAASLTAFRAYLAIGGIQATGTATALALQEFTAVYAAVSAGYITSRHQVSLPSFAASPTGAKYLFTDNRLAYISRKGRWPSWAGMGYPDTPAGRDAFRAAVLKALRDPIRFDQMELNVDQAKTALMRWDVYVHLPSRLPGGYPELVKVGLFEKVPGERGTLEVVNVFARGSP